MREDGQDLRRQQRLWRLGLLPLRWDEMFWGSSISQQMFWGEFPLPVFEKAFLAPATQENKYFEIRLSLSKQVLPAPATQVTDFFEMRFLFFSMLSRFSRLLPFRSADVLRWGISISLFEQVLPASATQVNRYFEMRFLFFSILSRFSRHLPPRSTDGLDEVLYFSIWAGSPGFCHLGERMFERRFLYFVGIF